MANIGNLTLGVPVLAGTGLSGIIGTGSIAVTPVFVGAGTRGNLGTGSLAILMAVFSWAGRGGTNVRPGRGRRLRRMSY